MIEKSNVKVVPVSMRPAHVKEKIKKEK